MLNVLDDLPSKKRIHPLSPDKQINTYGYDRRQRRERERHPARPRRGKRENISYTTA